MSRRPVHSSHSRSHSKRSPSPRQPTDVLTYRLNGEMVYVNAGEDYEEAIGIARNVFPQLQRLPRERIALHISVRVGEQLQTVRIAPMTWSRMRPSLALYEIVDITILPHSSAARAAKSDTDVRSTADDESGRYLRVDDRDNAPPTYPFGNSYPSSSDGLLGADLRDSEKSPSYTVQPPSPTSAPSQIKRSTSALGWLGRHF